MQFRTYHVIFTRAVWSVQSYCCSDGGTLLAYAAMSQEPVTVPAVSVIKLYFHYVKYLSNTSNLLVGTELLIKGILLLVI